MITRSTASRGEWALPNGRILHWWDQAWLGLQYRERFLLEAAVSLPTLVEELVPEDIYQAMLHQRCAAEGGSAVGEVDVYAVAAVDTHVVRLDAVAQRATLR